MHVRNSTWLAPASYPGSLSTERKFYVHATSYPYVVNS